MRQLLVASLVLLASAGCGSPDETPTSCELTLSPNNCTAQGCIGDSWSSDKAAYGAACQRSDDCQSGLCAFDPSANQRYCTSTCDPQATVPCPSGAACLSADKDGLYVCGPAGESACH